MITEFYAWLDGKVRQQHRHDNATAQTQLKCLARRSALFALRLWLGTMECDLHVVQDQSLFYAQRQVASSSL